MMICPFRFMAQGRGLKGAKPPPPPARAITGHPVGAREKGWVWQGEAHPAQVITAHPLPACHTQLAPVGHLDRGARLKLSNSLLGRRRPVDAGFVAIGQAAHNTDYTKYTTPTKNHTYHGLEIES